MIRGAVAGVAIRSLGLIETGPDPAARTCVHRRRRNGRAGTRAGDYLADAGLTQIAVPVVPIVETELSAAPPPLLWPAIQAARAAGPVPEADLRGWLDEQRRRDEKGRFLLAMSTFVTTAPKP
jgi:hypothetical protein